MTFLARLLLMLTLWNAPIPWVHVHGMPESADGYNRLLVEHLQVFHPGVNPATESQSGWHLHWILPWSVADGGPCPANPVPDRTPTDVDGPAETRPVHSPRFTAPSSLEDSLEELVRPARTSLAEFSGRIGDYDLRKASGAAGERAVACAHFFQTFPASVTLTALIGVALC